MKKPKEHLFAIIRVSQGVCATGEFREEYLGVPKLVRTIERAKAEVDRLNALNGNKGEQYLFLVSRLEPDEPGGSDAPDNS